MSELEQCHGTVSGLVVGEIEVLVVDHVSNCFQHPLVERGWIDLNSMFGSTVLRVSPDRHEFFPTSCSPKRAADVSAVGML